MEAALVITAVCPVCSRKFSFPDEQAGKKAKCKNCGAIFGVPAFAPASAYDDAPSVSDLAHLHEAPAAAPPLLHDLPLHSSHATNPIITPRLIAGLGTIAVAAIILLISSHDLLGGVIAIPGGILISLIGFWFAGRLANRPTRAIVHLARRPLEKYLVAGCLVAAFTFLVLSGVQLVYQYQRAADDREFAAIEARQSIGIINLRAAEDDYRRYLHNYPNGLHAEDAQRFLDIDLPRYRQDDAFFASCQAEALAVLDSTADIKRATDIFQKYRSAYPTGQHLNDITRITGTLPSLLADLLAYKDAVRKANAPAAEPASVVAAYEAYLADYPSGRHAEDARRLLDAAEKVLTQHNARLAEITAQWHTQSLQTRAFLQALGRFMKVAEQPDADATRVQELFTLFDRERKALSPESKESLQSLLGLDVDHTGVEEILRAVDAPPPSPDSLVDPVADLNAKRKVFTDVMAKYKLVVERLEAANEALWDRSAEEKRLLDSDTAERALAAYRLVRLANPSSEAFSQLRKMQTDTFEVWRFDAKGDDGAADVLFIRRPFLNARTLDDLPGLISTIQIKAALADPQNAAAGALQPGPKVTQDPTDSGRATTEGIIQMARYGPYTYKVIRSPMLVELTLDGFPAGFAATGKATTLANIAKESLAKLSAH